MATAPVAAKPRGKKKIVWLIVCLLGLGSGATAPMLLGGVLGKPKAEPKKSHPAKVVNVPFGDVVVNLAEERMTRYLRIKIVLSVDEEQEKVATEHITKQKAAMKNWLIGHLAGKSLKDVTGTAGVKKLQREIMERFEEMLYPDGEGHLHDVLFEEFVVQ